MDDFLVLRLIICCVCGVIAAAIASSKGRSVVGWFFGGFFLTIIGIIIVAVLHNAKDEQMRREAIASEQRRLREQLRQERMKNEAFRQYSLERLDTHDQLLGTDTRTRPALPGQSQQQPALGNETLADLQNSLGDGAPRTSMPTVQPLFQASAAPAAIDLDRLWYFEVQGQSQGPVSELDIRKMIHSKMITGQTLLWTDGLAEWQAAAALDAFKSQVQA